MNKSDAKASKVAAIITKAIHDCGKAQIEIAAVCGWPKPNIVTMIKQGSTRLPLDKVGLLARAVDLDPVYLLRVVMQEYMPDTYAAIEQSLADIALTDYEREVLDAYRELAKGRNMGVVVCPVNNVVIVEPTGRLSSRHDVAEAKRP